MHCSAQDWKFAAKQFLKKYPDDIVVHCEFVCLFVVCLWFWYLYMAVFCVVPVKVIRYILINVAS